MATRRTRISDIDSQRTWAVDTTETEADRKETIKILNKLDTAENWASRSSKAMNKNKPTWTLPKNTGMPTRVYPRTASGINGAGGKAVAKVYKTY